MIGMPVRTPSDIEDGAAKGGGTHRGGRAPRILRRCARACALLFKLAWPTFLVWFVLFPAAFALCARGPDRLAEGEPLRVALDGPVDWAMAERLVPVLAENRNRPVELRLDSPGGEWILGLSMAALIRSHPGGVRTIASQWCASACAEIWLAGAERRMEDGSVLAFHSAYVAVGGAEGVRIPAFGRPFAVLANRMSRFSMERLAPGFPDALDASEPGWDDAEGLARLRGWRAVELGLIPPREGEGTPIRQAMDVFPTRERAEMLLAAAGKVETGTRR